MQDVIRRLYVRAQIIFAQSLREENAQDLIEYALVIAVVCLGLVSGMNTLANGILNAMSTLSTRLNAAVA